MGEKDSGDPKDDKLIRITNDEGKTEYLGIVNKTGSQVKPVRDLIGSHKKIPKSGHVESIELKELKRRVKKKKER